MTKKTPRRVIMTGALGLLLIAACQNKTKIYTDNDPLLKTMDTAVKPGDDFF